MEKAAKVPARPCPLMMGVVYAAGSIPARPKRLPCRTAPNAVKRGHERMTAQGSLDVRYV